MFGTGYRWRDNEEFRVDDVKKAAGVSVQITLRAFGCKDSLLVATLETEGPKSVDSTAFANIKVDDIKTFVRPVFLVHDKVGDLVVQALANEHRASKFQKPLYIGRTHHKEWVSGLFALYMERRSPPELPILFHGLLGATDI